jgi:hypothetical protein
VYRFSCNSCNAVYIGQTKRHLHTRGCEHIGISALTSRPVKQSQNSAIKNHILTTGHNVSLNDFSIIAKGKSFNELCILESLFISKEKPILNKDVASMPLFLF